ncbi:MAG: oxygen-dependent coproporphyrinogen oxidase [Bacteroidota bacterium]
MDTASNYKTTTTAFRQKWIEHIYYLQEAICKALENTDGKARFGEDNWTRAEGRGGGGKTRVISNGIVFEKGGVNTSVVYGQVKEKMKQQLQVEGAAKWFAAGLSLVLHPFNPYVPTVHANWRYFELYDADDKVCDRWFGGGTDLTPYYLFEEDARHFHQTIKKAMDDFGKDLYAQYKEQCDEYFVNSHRNNERRGIGGVFYDHLRPENEEAAENLCKFQEANGHAFLESYLPIVEKRKNQPFGDHQKYWQEIRRGRYTEFNLLHDRGTLFGLRTNGRTESILMSLPPTVRFEYNYQPPAGTEEDKLLQVCLHPRNWLDV